MGAAEAIFTGIFVAGIVGLAGIAFKNPEAYQRLGRIVYWLALAVGAICVAWNANAAESVKIPILMAYVLPFGVAVYAWILSDLRRLLGRDKILGE